MTAHLCPPWCINPIPHDDEGNGYFHDGEAESTTVEIGDQLLIVKPIRFVRHDHTAEPARISLQDRRLEIALLTPAEARNLATTLSAAADAIEEVQRA